MPLNLTGLFAPRANQQAVEAENRNATRMAVRQAAAAAQSRGTVNPAALARLGVDAAAATQGGNAARAAQARVADQTNQIQAVQGLVGTGLSLLGTGGALGLGGAGGAAGGMVDKIPGMAVPKPQAPAPATPFMTAQAPVQVPPSVGYVSTQPTVAVSPPQPPDAPAAPQAPAAPRTVDFGEPVRFDVGGGPVVAPAPAAAAPPRPPTQQEIDQQARLGASRILGDAFPLTFYGLPNGPAR